LFFIDFLRDSNDANTSLRDFPFVSGNINAPNNALRKLNTVNIDQTHFTPNVNTNEGYILMIKNINSYPKACTIPPITPKKQ